MTEQPEFDFTPAAAEHALSVEQRHEESALRTVCGSSILPAGSVWQEVPQARFLSWSDEMQRSYCAARDLDSAENAVERGEDPEFYIQRAKCYLTPLS